MVSWPPGWMPCTSIGLQARAGGVDRRRVAGRAGPDDQNPATMHLAHLVHSPSAHTQDRDAIPPAQGRVRPAQLCAGRDPSRTALRAWHGSGIEFRGPRERRRYMRRVKLDRIDRRILHDLQADGRMTNVELARRAGHLRAALPAPGAGARRRPGSSRAITPTSTPRRWASASRSSPRSGSTARPRPT